MKLTAALGALALATPAMGFMAPVAPVAAGKAVTSRSSTSLKAGMEGGSVLTRARGDGMSAAIPSDKQPEGLDGTMAGDLGFDPAGFARNPPAFAPGTGGTLKWYREAELQHGRVAMIAIVGWLVPEFYHLPGNEQYGQDIFSNTDPLAAVHQVPGGGLFQIGTLIFGGEVARYRRCIKGTNEAGDMGLGQGPGERYNPFKFCFTPDQYDVIKLQEIKHGRLAMIAIIGAMIQAQSSHMGPLEQLAPAFNMPGAATKAGYFFPEGL